jgi:hypothetical protein
MKVIEKQVNNRTIKIMLISYKFKNFPNIVCSGSKIYQLPMQIGKKSYNLKELKPKYHQGSIIYLINSKRINSKVLKNNSFKVDDKLIIEDVSTIPF